MTNQQNESAPSEDSNQTGHPPSLIRVIAVHSVDFVCLFHLILYVPSTIFQLCRDGSSWVEPVLTLKTPRKNASENVVCCKLPNITDELCIEANSVDPEQEQSDLGPHCLS